MSAQEEVQTLQMEQALQHIQGISAARVVVGEDGDIAEVHLVGSSPRRPKQIVRDVETLLCARFGTRVDYRRISYTQLSSSERPRVRLRFVSAELHPTDSSQVQVILQNHTSYHEASAPIEQDGSDGVRATASATLRAVELATGAPVQLALQEARTVVVDSNEVALVVVQASTPQGEERLSGTCITRKSMYEAAAKATLDAINRRLDSWVTM